MIVFNEGLVFVEDTNMKKIRGQFFTVNSIVQELMLGLLTQQESWKILEPSAGSGDLIKAFKNIYPHENIVGWEIDKNVIPQDEELSIKNVDFFSEADQTYEKYHTILGNPPYVAWKNVEQETIISSDKVKKSYSDKCNLYHLFIDKCIDLLEDDGEIVFIVPKEWLYSTSARPLREKIMRTGTITHIIDGGEEKVFSDADVPAIMIFRYQKTQTNNHKIQYRKGLTKNITVWEEKTISQTKNNYWLILSPNKAEEIKNWGTLGEHFEIKVGIVSGADKIFNINTHNDKELFKAEGTTKDYLTTKGIETFIDINHIQNFDNIPEHTKNYMLQHKKQLINRRIASFNENNWWKYGAIRNKNLMESNKPRIYTYAKTRLTEPFFTNDEALYFSGGLLALFSKNDYLKEKDEILKFLNSTLFREICESLGLTTSNKVSFQPSTLETIPFPKIDYFKKLK